MGEATRYVLEQVKATFEAEVEQMRNQLSAEYEERLREKDELIQRLVAENARLLREKNQGEEKSSTAAQADGMNSVLPEFERIPQAKDAPVDSIQKLVTAGAAFPHAVKVKSASEHRRDQLLEEIDKSLLADTRPCFRPLVFAQPLLESAVNKQHSHDFVTLDLPKPSPKQSSPPTTLALSGRIFFKDARAFLSQQGFDDLLTNMKQLNQGHQSRTATLDAARLLFGDKGADLYHTFESLLQGRT